MGRGEFDIPLPPGHTALERELMEELGRVIARNRDLVTTLKRLRIAVGKEGKLTHRAALPGAQGSWVECVEAVNDLVTDLVRPTTEIARVIGAIADGDLSERMALEADGRRLRGELLRIAKLVNGMVTQLDAFAGEVTRVAREVGSEGKLGGQARVKGLAGTWKDLTDHVNSMASNLTAQVRNVAEVTTAVAKGDLSKKITVEVHGEMLELKHTINTMMDQLNALSSEVTRVAHEVGTLGRLGGQARVPGASGTWAALTDSVNSMASNLTAQVRNVAEVTTAVAKGDLSKKITVDVHGEMLELKNTINTMVDQLNAFASEVTRVAREVGVEGRLGGQARVPGAAGTWRDLTDNVNELAANLTAQVRAIGDVATAVTSGDLTRHVSVQASGEVAALKDNINEMIRNLRETTQRAKEQDWLKTNLARFSRMLQGQRDLMTVAREILSELAPLVHAQHGVVYLAEQEPAGETRLKRVASYAAHDGCRSEFRLGEGLVGQCALDRRKIVIDDVPDAHLSIVSGLGSSTPRTLVILPVLFEGEVNAVIELALLGRPSPTHYALLDELTETIGIVVNTISASMTTEALLTQSQSLTQELQSQQEELRQSNERLERQTATLLESEERLRLQQEALRTTNEQLEEKAKLLELRNKEIEDAKLEIEEKAEQLALTSRYKSEFLANMSHELRTPLNSLLILSKMMSENIDKNLTPKQVEFARTIHASGTELLTLINDVLDLSKIESGTIGVEPSEVYLDELRVYVEQSFSHVAQEKGLEFSIELDESLKAPITTDAKRLKQILKNLLSNAMKFTERGSVSMRIAPAGEDDGTPPSPHGSRTIAFSVSDTGPGIAADKQRIIFEAFQQADGTTSRRYGGTGLGLSISRELAKLLGGEVRVESALGIGSTFTLYLPASPARPTAVSAAPSPPPASRAAAPDLALPSVGAERLVLLGAASGEWLSALAIEAERLGRALTVAGDAQAAHAQIATRPCSGVIMDLTQGVEGWIALDRLSKSCETRHVPVVVRCAATDEHRALAMGAIDVIPEAPAAQQLARALAGFERFEPTRPRRILVLGEPEGGPIAGLLECDAVVVTHADGRGGAPAALTERELHCVVLVLQPSEEWQLALLRSLKAQDRTPPIVTYAQHALTWSEQSALGRHKKRLLLEHAPHEELLLEHVLRFAHVPAAHLSERQRLLAGDGSRRSTELSGTSVLLIDDDVRNIFAMASALERHGARVAYADNGRDGLDWLERNPGVHAVLVDVMMPDMDGYEVMRRIREGSASLPIVAVTANAMPTDRDQCLRAGATHYLAKPVGIQELVSALKVLACR